MMKQYRILALFLVLMLLVSLASGCSAKSADNVVVEEASSQETVAEEADAPAEEATPQEDAAEEPALAQTTERKTEAGTFTVGTTKETFGFDPTAGTFNAAGEGLIYETLFVVKNGEYDGVLADSYEWEDDLTLRINLKEGVTFSNGDPFTAEDVLYSLQRVTESQVCGERFSSFDIANSTAEDDYTVVLKFSTVCGPAMRLLSCAMSYITDASYIQENGDDQFWDAPVGTGPYVLTENVSGSHSRYEKRDDYWGDISAYEAETITIRNYGDAATMFIDFENGAIDACYGLSTTDTQRLINGEVDGCKYFVQSDMDAALLTFNMSNEYLQNEDVRKAITMAIDIPAIAEACAAPLYEPATSALSTSLAYHVDVGTYDFDPEAAKQLLTDAGINGGEITLSFLINAADPVSEDVATCIQGYLEEIGITVNVDSYELPVYLEHVFTGQGDLTVKSCGEGVTTADASQFFDTMVAGSTNLCIALDDPDFNEYIEAGFTSTDESDRAEAYANAQQWLYDNYQGIPLYYTCASYAYWDYITDLPLDMVTAPSTLECVSFAQ